jgi:LEA14-like dessication related protein
MRVSGAPEARAAAPVTGFVTMPLMRAPAHSLPAILATVLLGACALAPKFQAPHLSVAAVQVVGGDLWQQHLKVRLHVQNPNDRALPIQGIVYTLEVEGQPFASGESTASFVVPPLGEAEFDMNVTTNLAGTFVKLLGRAAESKSVAYHLTGKVSLSQGFLRSIPFDQRGTFNLQ